jgi:colanic acid/amylovoran biosynthesis protein
MVFLNALRQADLLVVSGAGTITDSQQGHARIVLNTLESAHRVGTPVALVGQGIGPLENPELLAWSKALLPSTIFIGLREGCGGPPILDALGVARERVMVTGDEAIELAYETRPDRLGEGVGINLRVANYAGIDDSLIDEIRPVLNRFVTSHNTELLPLPITHHTGSYDPSTISKLMSGLSDPLRGGEELDTPLKVITQAGRCRIALTGAYHAAVFALSQGIPAICIVGSPYYLNKFVGLADLFGEGCELVHLGDADFTERLAEAMEKAWEMANRVRASLLDAAARQVEASQLAYARIAETYTALVGGGTLAHATTSR